MLYHHSASASSFYSMLYIVRLQVDSKVLHVGKNYTVAVNITNPLPVRLTAATVTLEGPGLASPVTRKLK